MADVVDMNRRFFRRLTTSLLLVAVFAVPPSISLPSQENVKPGKTQSLLDALNAMGQEMEKQNNGVTEPPSEIVMIDSPGSYPPGRYIGRCEQKRAPKNPQIGDQYEVRWIESGFFRLEEDGNWNGVGSSAPLSANFEYRCQASEDYRSHSHQLGGSWKGNIRGPGNFKLLVSGYVEHYLVKKCITVGGGPCPNRVSREEIHYEIPFEIVAEN